MKQRILYIDILKLFTIYLVIWGHAIMHFQPDFKASIIFQIIYSFHMPLFMMLSGYFSTSSMELTPKAFFPKKFRQLLLHCISWGILCWLIITSGLIEGRFHLELKGLFTGWLGILENFWFLKSCLIPAAIADYDLIPTGSTTKVLEAFINNKKTIGMIISDFLHFS